MTPEEKFTGLKADVSHFKVFGSFAYVHIPNGLRTKLDPNAEKCIFIGTRKGIVATTLLHEKLR